MKTHHNLTGIRFGNDNGSELNESKAPFIASQKLMNQTTINQSCHGSTNDATSIDNELY